MSLRPPWRQAAQRGARDLSLASHPVGRSQGHIRRTFREAGGGIEGGYR